MKKSTLSTSLLLILLMTPGTTAQETDVWGPFRGLEGTWVAESDGAQVTQSYQLVFKSQFLVMKTRSVFEPDENRPEGEIHEDLGVFSYDSARQVVVLRSFYIEGFVNQYVLEKPAGDDTLYTFKTESIENAPPGTMAKLTYQFKNRDEIEQSFWVAFPGQEYQCFSTYLLKRKN